MDMSKVGEKIFGLYKTFHGNEDAKGLGLFITKSQVEALGGHINLQSEFNKGTIFKITFYGNN
jgi:signal transduction histidine kinase